MTSKLRVLLEVTVALVVIVRLPFIGRAQERLARWAALRKYADDEDRREIRAEEWPALIRESAWFYSPFIALSFSLSALLELAVDHARRAFRSAIGFPSRASDYPSRIRRNLALRRSRLGLAEVAVLPTGFSIARGQSRDFRRLIVGSSVSMLGSRITMIAYPMLIMYLYGSPFIVGLAIFATTVPRLLTYLPAGVLAERWDARQTMLVSIVGRAAAIATALVAMMTFHDRISIYFLIMAGVAEQILATFSLLGEQRYIGAVLGPGPASSAIDRTEAGNDVAGLVGLPVGWLLFSIAPTLPFLACLIALAQSVIVIATVRNPVTVQAGTALPPRRSYSQDIQGSMRSLRANTRVGASVVLSSNATLICRALAMVFLVGAHARQVPAVDIGAVLAAYGMGGLLGSSSSSRLPVWVLYRSTQVQMMAWTVALTGLAFGPQSWAWMALAAAILGFTRTIAGIQESANITQGSEPSMLASIMSIGRLPSFAAKAVGSVLGVLLVQDYGTQFALFSLIIMTMFLALISLWAHPQRYQSAPPAPPG